MTGPDGALFFVMADFPAEFEDETNRWFDFDHVPERLTCDGFLGCERFVAAGVEPVGSDPSQRWTKYINAYTIESLGVLESDAYRHQREMNDGRSSRWRQARDEVYRTTGRWSPSRTVRWVWLERPRTWARSGLASIEVPPPRVVHIVFRDVEAAAADEVNRYLDEELMPELMGLPGVIQATRYEAAPPLPPVPGESEGNVQPRYMEIYDLATPEVLTSETFSAHQANPSPTGVALRDAMPVRAAGSYVQRPSPWLFSIPTDDA